MSDLLAVQLVLSSAPGCPSGPNARRHLAFDALPVRTDRDLGGGPRLSGRCDDLHLAGGDPRHLHANSFFTPRMGPGQVTEGRGGPCGRVRSRSS